MNSSHGLGNWRSNTKWNFLKAHQQPWIKQPKTSWRDMARRIWGRLQKCISAQPCALKACPNRQRRNGGGNELIQSAARADAQRSQLIRRRHFNNAKVSRAAHPEAGFKSHQSGGNFGEVSPRLPPVTVQHLRSTKDSIDRRQ